MCKYRRHYIFLHTAFAMVGIRRPEGASIPLKFHSFLAIPEWEVGFASTAGSLLLPRVCFSSTSVGLLSIL